MGSSGCRDQELGTLSWLMESLSTWEQFSVIQFLMSCQRRCCWLRERKVHTKWSRGTRTPTAGSRQWRQEADRSGHAKSSAAKDQQIFHLTLFRGTSRGVHHLTKDEEHAGGEPLASAETLKKSVGHWRCCSRVGLLDGNVDDRIPKG